MTDRDVRARVESFVADFHRRWDRKGRSPNDPAGSGPEVFEAWAAELSELVHTHGTTGLRTGAEGSLSGLPAHDPEHESITEARIEGDRAVVRSVHAANPPATYYEYRLERLDHEWRIARILSFLNPPGTPLVDPSEVEALLASASADAPLTELPPELDLDLPSLFAPGREVTPFGAPVPLDIVGLGEISIRSGVLAVCDLGWVRHDLEPLARLIPTGTFPVEVSRADGTNVALRMRLTDAPAVSWHPAQARTGANVVGVDAGNVAIVDVGVLVECEARHVEELFTSATQQAARDAVLSLGGGSPDAVMVTSGYGDGAYPCYWGVASDGRLSSLVVDFLVLAQPNVTTVQVPWRPGRVEVPELGDQELAITSDNGAATISHRGQVHRIRVLAPDGTVLVDGHQLGMRVEGDQHSQTWEPDSPPGPGTILEVTLHRGYRHT